MSCHSVNMGLLRHKPVRLIPHRTFLNLIKPEQEYTIKKKIQHPPDTLFKVVSNVSDYSKFVPYCTRSFVTEFSTDKLPKKGGLRVGFKDYDEEFICNITCEDNKHPIPKLVEAESLSDNLFDHLKMQWYIENDPKKADVSRMTLKLKYKFTNPVYNTVSSLVASKITSIMIKAFNDRAAQIRNEASKCKE